MRLLEFLKETDVNRAVEERKRTPGAILLDVRTAEEYRAGHIPDGIHLPLREIGRAKEMFAKHTPIYVYSQNGGKSMQAASALVKMGFRSVKNIGGIVGYTGKIEK